MPKIIIWNDRDFLIANLEGKTEKSGVFKIAKFKEYKLIKSQTINKQLKRIEAVINYSSMKLEEREEK